VTPEQLLGRYLRELRLAHGLSLEDVRRHVSFGTSYLSAIENGQRKAPMRTISELVSIFGMSLCDVLVNSGYCLAIESEKLSGKQNKEIRLPDK